MRNTRLVLGMWAEALRRSRGNGVAGVVIELATCAVTGLVFVPVTLGVDLAEHLAARRRVRAAAVEGGAA